MIWRKICPECKKEFDGKYPSAKYCPDCLNVNIMINSREKRKEYNKRYREKDKEKRKEYAKTYYQNHKENIKKSHKRYRENNKKKRKKYAKTYRKEHKQEFKGYYKSYYQNHKEKLKEYQKRYLEKNKEKLNKHNSKTKYSNSIKKDRYNDDKRYTIEKRQVNTLLSREASSTNKGNALVLDGKNINTTNMLIRKGFKNENIYIPNYVTTTYEKILKKKKKNVFNMTLGNFIESNKNNLTFDVVFADYMGCLNGNKTDGIFPRDDIKKLFDYKLLNDNSVFAITLSFRKPNRSESIHEDFVGTICMVEQYAKNNGYETSLIGNTKIYGSVFFLMFNINKK